MKITVNLGDELKGAKIEHPENVPVKINGEIIGMAIIQSNGTAELNIINEGALLDFVDILNFNVGGIVKHREGNLITDFSLKDVFLVPKIK